jgi:hypothetical protein
LNSGTLTITADTDGTAFNDYDISFVETAAVAVGTPLVSVGAIRLRFTSMTQPTLPWLTLKPPSQAAGSRLCRRELITFKGPTIRSPA